MKKILLVFDGAHFSEGAFEFSRVMNELQPLLLTGVFLPQADYGGLFNNADAITTPLNIPVMDINKEIIQKNISRFRAHCENQGIEYRMHEDNLGFVLPELKNETRFADLLVIGSESFYNYIAIREPNEYVQATVHGSESPVLLVPEKFTFPVNNILCYDGGESSVYAIKQFAYLFPELTKNPSLLIYARRDTDTEIPDNIKMEELVSRHFPDLTITSLELEPRKNFYEWVSEKEGSIIVSGSFGRSLLSRLFKKSFASGLISDHRLPVFIAHK
jgi:hypothetical protein